MDVFGRELDGGADGFLGVADRVVFFVVGFEAAQDFDGVFDVGLVDVDLLEAANEGPVFFEVVAEFLVRGAADATHVAAGQGGFQQVGGVHRAARGGAGADHGVDFVDEQDGVGVGFELGDDGLEALLEVAAVTGAGEEGAHVEREDGGFGEDFGHVAVDDALGQALGDGGFADAGVTDVERVVLGAAAEDLDGALDFGLAADERVDLAGLGLLVEVDAVIAECVLALAPWLLLAFHFAATFLVAGALHRAGGGAARRLGDTVADEIHRVEPGHVLGLQEVDRVAFAFAEQGDEDVGAGDFVAAGGLDVDGGALDDALEAGGWFWVAGAVGGEARQVFVEELGEFAAQLVDVDTAGAQHGCGVSVVGQTEQEVLQSGVFVLALGGETEGAVERLFKIAGQHGCQRSSGWRWSWGLPPVQVMARRYSSSGGRIGGLARCNHSRSPSVRTSVFLGPEVNFWATPRNIETVARSVGG